MTCWCNGAEAPPHSLHREAWLGCTKRPQDLARLSAFWLRLALSRFEEFLFLFLLVERLLSVEVIGVIFFFSKTSREVASKLIVLPVFCSGSWSF